VIFVYFEQTTDSVRRREILGFFRYGHWSKPDMRSGSVGIRHGRAVRKGGATVLPALIQRDLSEPN